MEKISQWRRFHRYKKFWTSKYPPKLLVKPNKENI